MKPIICFFDGACSPRNPGGHMGWGAIVQLEKECKHFYGGKLESENNTNNVAEYMAFLELMHYFEGSKGLDIIIHGDSKLVIKQMQGHYKIKSGKYKMLAVTAKKYVMELLKNNKLTLHWIPRELNTDADELSNYGIATLNLPNPKELKFKYRKHQLENLKNKIKVSTP